MKKTFRKMSVALAAVMAVAATSMMPVSAEEVENNHSNTYWTVNNNVYTQYREKWDDSSAYIKNAGSNAVTVSIYGAAGANTRTYSVSECSEYYTVLKTTNLYMPGNCERLIKQYVYENDYTHAMIYIRGTSNGAWSPDSIGTYEFLNGSAV